MTAEEIVNSWYIKKTRIRIREILFCSLVALIIGVCSFDIKSQSTTTNTIVMQKESKTVRVKEMNAKPQERTAKQLTKEETDYRAKVAHLSEQELLASLMYHEEGVLLSRIDYEDAKRAHLLAGSVVLHRTNMNYMGAETIEDTIFAPGQYIHTLPKLANPVPEEVLEWAGELLENGPIGPSDMIFQAQFIQGDGIYAHIDNQYFCTDGEYEN